jgi:hypothetical protein
MGRLTYSNPLIQSVIADESMHVYRICIFEVRQKL